MIELPKEVMEQLRNAENNKEACRILSDNGYDPESVKQSLADEYLQNIDGGAAGGSNERRIDYICPHCKNEDKETFSCQFFKSFFSAYNMVYRCRKCNKYFQIDMHTGKSSPC